MVASFVLCFISQKRPCYQSVSASTQDLSLCHLLSHRCACCAAPRVLPWFKVSLHLTTHEPAPGAGSPATQNALCRAVDVTPFQAEGCSDTAYTCLPQRTPHFKLGSPNESLTSPSLPGSPRLPEPRVQRWLRGWGTGDRSPSGDRRCFSRRTLTASHGCSQSSRFSREFYPSCGHAPGKAKQNSGTFGKEAASPDRFFQRGGGGKRLLLRGEAAPGDREGDETLLPRRPRGSGGSGSTCGSGRWHLPVPVPLPSPFPARLRPRPVRYRHRSCLGSGTPEHRRPFPPVRSPHSLSRAASGSSGGSHHPSFAPRYKQ